MVGYTLEVSAWDWAVAVMQKMPGNAKKKANALPIIEPTNK